jgi:hypothetical protein
MRIARSSVETPRCSRAALAREHRKQASPASIASKPAREHREQRLPATTLVPARRRMLMHPSANRVSPDEATTSCDRLVA